MRDTATSEAVAILSRLTTAILASGVSGAGETGAGVRRACGTLTASAPAALASGQAGALVLACFDAAVAAKASLDGMARVRAAILAEVPVQWIGQAVVSGALRFCLAAEVQILTTTTLVSRNEVERYSARMHEAFNQVEDVAADAGDTVGYRALVNLHAAVTRDLEVRGRPLPRMVSFEFAACMPALAMSNRFYGDAGRADDLVRENGVVHPLFMPRSGRALAG